MGLPYVIEYLLTLRKPGGGHLVHQGASQTIVPAMPPNIEVVLQVFPLGDDYADIVYSSYIDPSVVPGAFYGWGQYFGARSYEGTLTTGFLTYPLETLVFISQSEPGLASIRNLTALNQYYAGMAFFITIASEDDYNTVMDALKHMGTSAKSEQLAEEANCLLSIMAGVEAGPRPPIAGGVY